MLISVLRCFVENCDGNGTSFNDSFVEWAIPSNDEECSVRKLFPNSTGVCEEDEFSEATEKCDEFVYDTTDFKSTTVTEVSLCHDESI